MWQIRLVREPVLTGREAGKGGVGLAPEQEVRLRRLLAAAGLAVGRLRRVDVTSDETFAPLGESLFWLAAIGDLVGGSVDGYRQTRVLHKVGATLPGLIYARDQITHGAGITGMTRQYWGASPLWLGESRLGSPPEQWWLSRADRPKAGRAKQVGRECYYTHLGGRPVVPTLEAALEYLREVVATSTEERGGRSSID